MPAAPTFQEFMNPVLTVLRRFGRPATIAELEAATVEEMKRSGVLSDEAASVLHNPERSDSQTEAGYRIAWTRTYLKKAGLITNPTHGSWTLTDRGRQAGTIDAHAVAREVAKAQEGSKENPLLRSALGLHPVVARRLHAGYEEMLPEFPTKEELEANYAAFRRHFGPSVLEGLDGEELLLRMHDRGTKESLVYWLEFKNDEEFPARFGSISGGSALKFGMYRSAETGRWMTGHPTKQVPMSIADAVDLARQQRDELIAGARVLEQHASRGGQPDYAAIQRDLEAAAPKLYDTAWGHKYFSLVRPDLIDDFHSTDWQRHHLRRLLRPMPAGRYEAASFFRELALVLEAPINSISGLMNHVHGGPQQYWRFDLRGRTELWSSMLASGACPYELSGLPDQTGTPSGSAGRRLLREAVREVLGEEREPVARELYWFLHTMGLGDRILVMDGTRVRAIGEVKGDAAFSADIGQHQRLVEWLDGGAWELPGLEGEDARLLLLPKEAEYLIEVERRLLEPEPIEDIIDDGGSIPPPPPLAPLTGVLARVQLALARKRQVVLYGPPGTGKTHWATLGARELAARSWFKKSWNDLSEAEKNTVGTEAVQTCCFHPAYGYEDFIEGYRPVQADGGALAFELRDGVFKRVVRTALQSPQRDHFIVIDEINRGDVPRIFGELLLVLERDKRGRPVQLPVSGEALVVPDNVYVIGTMNTADRSVALLDAALRRRFSFIELMPDVGVLRGSSAGGIPLGPWLEELNRRVVRHAGRDARNLQVGHSYLLEGGAPITSVQRFAEVLRDDIIPLLEEYCYEDFGALERILGPTLVSQKARRINDGLFLPERQVDFVQALLSAFDTITATIEAVTGTEETEAGEEEVVPEGDPPEEANA